MLMCHLPYYLFRTRQYKAAFWPDREFSMGSSIVSSVAAPRISYLRSGLTNSWFGEIDSKQSRQPALLGLVKHDISGFRNPCGCPYWVSYVCLSTVNPWIPGNISSEVSFWIEEFISFPPESYDIS